MHKYEVGDRDGRRHCIEASYCVESGGNVRFFNSEDKRIASFREVIYWIELKKKGEKSDD